MQLELRPKTGKLWFVSLAKKLKIQHRLYQTKEEKTKSQKT